MNISLAELFCPHHCISCGKIGGILCECCKKYILDERKLNCLKCGAELIHEKCVKCDALPCLQFYVGKRKGALKSLINNYKYNSVRACGDALAELLAECINIESAVVVPLPTIGKHVRERGFDHTKLLARKLVRLKGWKCECVIERANNTVQVGASNEKRKVQAKEAYIVRQKLDPLKTYILLDDVWTTGSSMMAAYEKIFQAGARKIVIAVIAKSG